MVCLARYFTLTMCSNFFHRVLHVHGLVLICVWYCWQNWCCCSTFKHIMAFKSRKSYFLKTLYRTFTPIHVAVICPSIPVFILMYLYFVVLSAVVILWYSLLITSWARTFIAWKLNTRMLKPLFPDFSRQFVLFQRVLRYPTVISDENMSTRHLSKTVN